MKRLVLFLLLLPVLFPQGALAVDGYRFYEGTAATVNKEVLLLSDVVREQCLLRCAAMPGSREENRSLQEARNQLIADTLALQEQNKLLLGHVDNAVLADLAREAVGRTEKCGSPCRTEISPKQVGEWLERKLLIRDFLRRRVAVFVEVKDDDVRKELQRRLAGGDAAAGLSEDKVREDLLEEKISQEVRNWYARAASKSSITLSPMEEK